MRSLEDLWTGPLTPAPSGGNRPGGEIGLASILGGCIRLGSLEVRPAARTLRLGGVPIELGGRAFDLLLALIEARGAVVSRDDLLRQVWPSVTVVDSNLKVQLCVLRRALGPESWRIKTIAGRGYLLVFDDAGATPATPAAERPLVIVIDADRRTQELVVRALSDVARYFDGVTRLALIPHEGEGQAFIA